MESLFLKNLSLNVVKSLAITFAHASLNLPNSLVVIEPSPFLIYFD